MTFLADHGIILVGWIVRIAEAPVWTEFKLLEVMAKFSLVADIVSDIELIVFTRD